MSAPIGTTRSGLRWPCGRRGGCPNQSTVGTRMSGAEAPGRAIISARRASPSGRPGAGQFVPSLPPRNIWRS
jgi:hypothetical protein